MTSKSKREIERKVDKMDTNPTGEYPQLDSLAMILGYEWERLDPENNLYRREDSGEVYHMPPEFMAVLESAVEDEL